MSTPSESDQSIYYVPEQGWYPVFLAFGLMVTVTGLAAWMNDLRGGDSGDLTQTFIGFLITSTVLYFWFAKAIAENASGMNNAALNKSYVLGMGWFIFSEVWFFFGILWGSILRSDARNSMDGWRRSAGADRYVSLAGVPSKLAASC
jgi:cytochrome c oxidase subunit 3